MKKDCGNHGDCHRRKLLRHIAVIILSLLFTVLFIIFLIWLILRPTKPRFYLQESNVRELSVNSTMLTAEGGSLINAVIQVTVGSHNPNDRVGVYYDRLEVYASYKYQQITLASALPPVYQGHKDFTVWSPVVSGSNIPVAQYVSDALQQDCAAGFLLLQVRIEGEVRWKVGSWISRHYNLAVNCPALLASQPGNGNRLLFQQIVECHVEV